MSDTPFFNAIEINGYFGFFIRNRSISIVIFGLRNIFFRDLLLDNLLRGFFGSPIFRDFFDELFLKRGEESGAPQPENVCFWP